jgi:type IV pilus assembly protein PilB
VLIVAMGDPTNVLILDDVRMATHISQLRATVATVSDLREAVKRYYGGQGGAAGAADALGALKEVEGLEVLEDTADDEVDIEAAEDAPVVKLVNAIMGEALYSRASDVHIQPRNATCGSASASTACSARPGCRPAVSGSRG